jgi:hypothetical protein
VTESDVLRSTSRAGTKEFGYLGLPGGYHEGIQWLTRVLTCPLVLCQLYSPSSDLLRTSKSVKGILKEAETGSPHARAISQGGGPFKPTTESCRVILYGDRQNRSDLGFSSQASARCYFLRVSSREREGKLKLTPVFPKYRLSAVSYEEAAGSLSSRKFSKLPAAS